MGNLVAITDICDFQGGSQPPKNEWSDKMQDGYIRMLQIRDFTQNREDKKEYIKFSNSIKTCKADDILIARYGASIGKILTGLEGAYNVAIMKTIPDENQITKGFLKHLLLSNTFQHFIQNVGSRAAQAGFNKNDLEKMVFYLPSLVEQQKIVAILDKADEIRTKKKFANDKLDEFLKSTFIDMFGDPVKNEKNYPIQTLQDSTVFLTDGKHGDCEDEEDSGCYFVSAKCISNGKIDLSQARQIKLSDFQEVNKRVRINVGDLLIVNTGATIGKMAIIRSKELASKITLQKSVAVINLDNTKLNAEYLSHCMFFKSIANISAGSAIHNLLLSTMRAYKLPIPPIDKQNRFAEIVEHVEVQKQKNEQVIEQMNNLFNSLSQKAFKGEL